MAITPGTRIGPYEVLASIGAGGMGEVYRARDKRLDRDVALKILPESFALDPERRARFEREAKAVAALSHPNILAIFDVGEADGRFYAATELLEGQTLRERLTTGALPARKAIEYGVQLARGLASAHDKGIVHRDLKPENIFLAGDGLVKILDFGLAKAVGTETAGGHSGATETMAVTDPGTVMGTVGYMAPEQVRGRSVDARTDLFSLGAVLYEMVTGKRAFQRDTPADTMSAILHEDPPELTGNRADLSPALDRIVRHCLEKEANERFQTARDVAFALTSLSGSATSVTSGAAMVNEMHGVHDAPSQRRRWMPAIATVAVIVAGAAGVTAGRSMAPEPASVSFVPKTVVPQAIFNARFMPDGKTLIYSSAMTGNAVRLYEVRDGSVAPRPIGPPDTHLLSISRSGELAVIMDARFLAHRLTAGKLARMSPDGTPRPIAEDVREADWLPDGSDLAVIRIAGNTDHVEFPIGHVVHRAAGYASDPRVSPDGTMLAFMDHPAKYDNRGWVKVVDRNGRVTTIGGEFSGEEGIAWSSDSRTVYFSGVTNADRMEYAVYSAPASGSSPMKLAFSAAGSLYLHDRGPDGRFMVTREHTTYGSAARGVGEERDLTPLDQAWGADLSKDGTFATMTDGRGGNDYAVVLVRLDGSPPARLGEGNSGWLSPDDRWVTANTFSNGRCMVYPTGTGKTVPIELGSLEKCVAARWFPDGKSLLVFGNEPGKSNRSYRVSFPGGTPTPLLEEGFETRALSDDGRHLLVGDPQGEFHRVTIGGATMPVKGLQRGDDAVEWSGDLKHVIVAPRGVFPSMLFKVNLETGERTKVLELTPKSTAGMLAMFLHEYRSDSGHYVYGYIKRVSALYLAEGVR